MYKVSEFSEMTGLSKETLRYYAEVKLMEPAYIDPKNNYRYYDDGSYFLALLLVKLRSFRFTIQEMISVMEDESFAHLEDLLIQKKETIRLQMEELQQKKKKSMPSWRQGRRKNNDSVARRANDPSIN